MKLGVLIEGQEGLTWNRWRRIVAAADELGFESLWRSDHLMSLADPSRDALETWVSLAVAASETVRLRFGPLVCPITFRHPSMLAKLAVSVDCLSQGRLVLGLGAGWNDAEHRAFGISFPPSRERLDRLEEGVEVVSRLMADEPAEFEGRYYRVEGARAHPKPFQHPRVPILIGGGGEHRTLRIVARLADEWDVPGGLAPDAFRAKSARLDERCHEIGRDPDEILRSASTAFLIGRNTAELRERSAALRRMMPSLANVDVSAVPDALRAMSWRVGTPDRIAADLLALADAGAERVILQHNDHDDIDALRLVAGEVMPRLAERKGRSGK